LDLATLLHAYVAFKWWIPHAARVVAASMTRIAFPIEFLQAVNVNAD
jgi:hypothetical protein